MWPTFPKRRGPNTVLTVMKALLLQFRNIKGTFMGFLRIPWAKPPLVTILTTPILVGQVLDLTNAVLSSLLWFSSCYRSAHCLYKQWLLPVHELHFPHCSSVFTNHIFNIPSDLLKCFDIFGHIVRQIHSCSKLLCWKACWYSLSKTNQEINPLLSLLPLHLTSFRKMACLIAMCITYGMNVRRVLVGWWKAKIELIKLKLWPVCCRTMAKVQNVFRPQSLKQQLIIGFFLLHYFKIAWVKAKMLVWHWAWHMGLFQIQVMKWYLILCNDRTKLGLPCFWVVGGHTWEWTVWCALCGCSIVGHGRAVVEL